MVNQGFSPVCENALTKFLQLYYLVLFEQNNSMNIFSDVSYSQYEKMKDFINDRYKIFQVMYPKQKELIHNFFCTLSKRVFSEFEVLPANPRES
jgi:hypothetical protein